MYLNSNRKVYPLLIASFKSIRSLNQKTRPFILPTNFENAFHVYSKKGDVEINPSKIQDSFLFYSRSFASAGALVNGKHAASESNPTPNSNAEEYVSAYKQVSEPDPKPKSNPESKFTAFIESKVAYSGISKALQQLKLPPKGKFQRRISDAYLERELNALLKPWFGLVHTYQARLILKEIKNPYVAIRFFDWVNSQTDFTADDFLHGELIQVLGNKKCLTEMELIYLNMRERGLNPTAEIYSNMIEAYCVHGWIMKSLIYYERMIEAGFTPDMITYKMLIRECSNQGFLKECLKIYMEMLASAIQPDYEFCSKMIEICARLGETEKAMAVFRYMSESNDEITTDTYNFMMNMFILYKDMDSATMLFEEMIKKKVTPNLTTYSVLMAGYKSRRMKKEASNMVEKLRERGVLGDVNDCNEEIKSFVKSGKLHQALTVFEKMEESNVLPNQFTYSYLIHGCLKVNKFNDANYLINVMQKEMLLPCLNAYSNALLEFIECDDDSISKQLWSVMERLQHPIHRLISLLSHGRLKEESWKWIAIYIDELDREKYNQGLYFSNLLIDYSIKTVSRKCALRMYEELRKKGVYFNAFEKTMLTWTVNFHDIPPSVALMALRFEFGRLHRLASQNVLFPKSVFVFIGLGWHSHVKTKHDLKNTVVGWLEQMASPFDFLHGSEGKMHAKGYKVKEWLMNAYIGQVLDSVEESNFEQLVHVASLDLK